MGTFPYRQYDGVGLAELIQTKQVKKEEVLDSAIIEIEKWNPSLRAVIHTMYDQAKRTIEKDETGTFAGVPILLKDITQEIKGEPLTSGSKAFASYKAKQDSEYVRRVRNTGAVFVGQTNVPEFALMGITEPAFHGPTRNPWNMEYTPGGSSGGSGAAVASGMVPIAGANDGGGSIRIPAAYCGLFGMKPTRGRTPAGPTYGRHWQGASVDHVLTRTVRDSAAMLDEISGYEKGNAFSVCPHPLRYMQYSQTPIESPLTIAFSTTSPLGTEVDDDCKEAVLTLMKKLEKEGHHVIEKQAPVDGKALAKSYLTMYFGEVAATLYNAEEQLGKKVTRHDVEPATWLLHLMGKATSAQEFVLSLREWDKAAFQMESFFEQYDFYVTPTTAFPPAKIGELEQSKGEKMLISLVNQFGVAHLLKKVGFVDKIAETSLLRTPFTQLANLTGQPAMSVPVHMTKAGLPCGVQFMAAKGKEDRLYQLAGMLEKTKLWVDTTKNPTILNK